MMGNNYTTDHVQKIYDLLVNEHKIHLSQHGVKMPRLKTGGNFNHRALQLVYLRMHLKSLVHKNAISDFVRQFSPSAAGDQQPRHLAYDGWDVRLSGKARDSHDGIPVPNGYNVLASVEAPKVDFITKRLKRRGRVSASGWAALQAVYENKCATCGDFCPGKLEKGHMDPRKPLEIANIIPMCGGCNNAAGDKVVFNEDGRVVALASPALVMASDDQVQYDTYLKLAQRFGNTRSISGDTHSSTPYTAAGGSPRISGSL